MAKKSARGARPEPRLKKVGHTKFRAPRGSLVGPFGAIDGRSLSGLAERLRGAGYDEARIAQSIGLPHLAALSRDRIPLHRTRLDPASPLDVAISFFILNDELSAADLAPLTGDEGADLLERLDRSGLLQVRGRGRAARLRSKVAIYPCAGALIATDPRFTSGVDRAGDGGAVKSGARPAKDAVMYLGGDSYALAYLAPRRAVARALDLCTGSGVHAILAARHAEHVTAVDISPRALAFGRLNAAMNDLAGRIEWRLGDLYGPLADGERFDLLLANPPFVPSPHEGRARLLYRDGGADGGEVVSRLLHGLHGRLAKEGVAAIVSVFPEKAGETLRGSIEARLPRGAELSGVFVRLGDDSPAEYAHSQTRRPYGDAPADHAQRFTRWLETLTRARIRRLGGGVLALKPHHLPSAPWWRTIDAPPPLGPDPSGIERLLRAGDVALGAVFLEELLERRAAAAADIVFVDELRRPSQEELRRFAAGDAEEEEGRGEAKEEAPAEGAAGAEGPPPEFGAARAAGEGAPGADPGDTPEKDAAPPASRDDDGPARSDGAGAEPGAGDIEEAPALVPHRHRVRAGSALGSEVGISGELRALLERADGTRTLRAVIAGMASEVEADAKELEERILPDAIELAARAFLVLDRG